MSDTYYGAPNDFRAYIAHRMSDHRDEPSIHKAHKDASSKNKRDQKQATAANTAEQRNLRSQFSAASTRFLQALANPRTTAAMGALKLLHQKCQNIFTTARNEDRWLTLTEMQTVQNFIEKFNSAMSQRPESTGSNRWS